MQTSNATSAKEHKSDYKVYILHEGYSEFLGDEMKANCTCTVIKGRKNIIVDTMTPWDKDLILEKLKSLKIDPSDISYVISTHGHSDHCGNNNLFLEAVHIVGYCISKGDIYKNHPFDRGLPYEIDDGVSVIPTPGHMMAHVSVAVKTANGTVVVAGDLFENEKDLSDENVWIDAGSEDESKQRTSRAKILKIADWIIPGHGKMFKVSRP